jgi:hypothetical protein
MNTNIDSPFVAIDNSSNYQNIAVLEESLPIYVGEMLVSNDWMPHGFDPNFDVWSLLYSDYLRTDTRMVLIHPPSYLLFSWSYGTWIDSTDVYLYVTFQRENLSLESTFELRYGLSRRSQFCSEFFPISTRMNVKFRSNLTLSGSTLKIYRVPMIQAK